MALTAPFLLVSPHLPLLAPGLPASAFAVVCPTVAALLVSRLRHGPQAVRELLRRSRMPADSREWRWCALAACLPILVTVISVWWQGASPSQAAPGLISFATVALICAVVAGAWLEELGWSAFATEALLPVCGLVGAGLVIGLVWALWHYVPLLQVGRSTAWIAWWTLGTIGMRLTLVALYLRGNRNVWVPTLFHAADSACWQVQESLGARFDPRVHGLAMAALAALIVALTFRFAPTAPLADDRQRLGARTRGGPRSD